MPLSSDMLRERKMSRVCLLLALLAIGVLGSQIGFSSEKKMKVESPSLAQQKVEDQNEKTKNEKVKTGIYRDLKWYRNVKRSALELLYADYAKNVGVLYKYEPAAFINVVPWREFLMEIKSGHLVFANLKKSEYEISPDSINMVHHMIDYEQLPQSDNTTVLFLLSTYPVIFDKMNMGKVVSWHTGVPVDELVPDQPKPGDRSWN